MDSTLTPLLRTDAVPLATLHDRYGALLELVRKLIGVVPSCDPYLQTWPPAFRTYNVLVPSFLNLPFALWGAAPSDVLGLAMYVASRRAGGAHGSARTSSFAMRAHPDEVARAMDGDAPSFTPAEIAVIHVARSLAAVPCALTQAERAALGRAFSASEVEWVVLAVAMMGFVDKFTDALGAELEVAAASEPTGPSGWADTFAFKLSLLPFIPSALSADRRWTSGVPNAWPAVGKYLRVHTGFDFPLLARLQHKRAIRAVAVMLRDNLDAHTTVLGLPLKCAAGMVFATMKGDAALARAAREIAAKCGATPAQLDEAERYAGGASESAGESPRARTVLRLARTLSPSPARIPEELLDECREAGLAASALVELVAWLSVLQMLHRVGAFFEEG
jgi:hypothetical protein